MPSGISPLPWVARIAVHRLVLPRQARLTLAAFGRVERDDVVAGLHRGDARADLAHDARALVAEDAGNRPSLIEPVERVGVGVADAGRHDLDQHLAGLAGPPGRARRSPAAASPRTRRRRGSSWAVSEWAPLYDRSRPRFQPWSWLSDRFSAPALHGGSDSRQRAVGGSSAAWRDLNTRPLFAACGASFPRERAAKTLDQTMITAPPANPPPPRPPLRRRRGDRRGRGPGCRRSGRSG